MVEVLLVQQQGQALMLNGMTCQEQVHYQLLLAHVLRMVIMESQ